MPHKSKQPDGSPTREPDVIGKPHGEPKPDREGSELARDKQRTDGGPRYGGGPWELAEERGDDRFGHARNDDANPSELSAGKGAVDDDEWPGHDASLQTGASGESEDVSERAAAEDNGATEAGAQRAGMSRGEKPRKPASRGKGNE